MVERLAPLEARLAEVEGGVARVLPLAEDDPRAALAALKARIEALDHAQERWRSGSRRCAPASPAPPRRRPVPRGCRGACCRARGRYGGRHDAGQAAALAEVVDGMTRLYAQKDAGLAALLGRLAPLEERLAAVEARPRDPAVEEAVDGAAGATAEAEAARAEAQAVAEQLGSCRPRPRRARSRAALFADRISTSRRACRGSPPPRSGRWPSRSQAELGAGIRRRDSGRRDREPRDRDADRSTSARPAAGGLAPPEVTGRSSAASGEGRR